MRTRRAWLMAAMLLVPVVAGADSHKTECFLAGSYANQSTLLGPYASWTQSFHKHEHKSDPQGLANAGQAWTSPKHPWSWVLLDLGAHFPVDDHDKAFTVMSGPRYTVAMTRDKEDKTTSTIFIQTLFGYGRTSNSDTSTSVSNFAFALGVGGDYLPWSEHRLGLRAQVDFVRLTQQKDWYPRVSVGVVKRWNFD